MISKVLLTYVRCRVGVYAWIFRRDVLLPREPTADLYPVLVALMAWGDRYAVGPEGLQVLLRHRDCGEPVQLQLSCRAGHVLDSAAEVTPVPGPGARKIA